MIVVDDHRLNTYEEKNGKKLELLADFFPYFVCVHFNLHLIYLMILAKMYIYIAYTKPLEIITFALYILFTMNNNVDN